VYAQRGNEGVTHESLFDPASCCTLNRERIATRYISSAEDSLEELTAAGFAIAHSEIVPRQGPDDQDDLVAIAARTS
jgi:hypothetical protein